MTYSLVAINVPQNDKASVRGKEWTWVEEKAPSPTVFGSLTSGSGRTQVRVEEKAPPPTVFGSLTNGSGRTPVSQTVVAEGTQVSQTVVAELKSHKR